MKLQKWSVQKIISEFRTGKKPVICKKGPEYFDFGIGVAKRMTGEYSVQELSHEIVVIMKVDDR